MNWRTMLKVALGAGALQLYCAPLVLRNDELSDVKGTTNSSSDALFRDILFLRMWLAFTLTLGALCGVVSQSVVLGASHTSRLLERTHIN